MIKSHFYNPPANNPGCHNFGDMLVPIIIKWMTGHEVRWVEPNIRGKLLCIGSEMTGGVLQQNDVVWGYGAKYAQAIKVPENVKFLAVRGKKTRSLIHGNVPEVYGDPACLMPLIYTPKVAEKRYAIGIIPHYVDREYVLKLVKPDPAVLILNIKDDPLQTIDNMNACDLIVSTSLHGCIVAEAYGIPTVWLKLGDRIFGLHMKWNDYFSDTGRDDQIPITDLNMTDIVNKVLPTPIFNREALLNAWKNNDTSQCTYE